MCFEPLIAVKSSAHGWVAGPQGPNTKVETRCETERVLVLGSVWPVRPPFIHQYLHLQDLPATFPFILGDPAASQNPGMCCVPAHTGLFHISFPVSRIPPFLCHLSLLTCPNSSDGEYFPQREAFDSLLKDSCSFMRKDSDPRKVTVFWNRSCSRGHT